MAWAELTDTALDLGVRVSPADTPREVARLMMERMAASADHDSAGPDPADRNDTDRRALDRVLGDLERLRFARPRATPFALDITAGGALADDVVRVRRALSDASPRAARLRAAVAPASLTGIVQRDRWATAHGQASAGA